MDACQACTRSERAPSNRRAGFGAVGAIAARPRAPCVRMQPRDERLTRDRSQGTRKKGGGSWFDARRGGPCLPAACLPDPMALLRLLFVAAAVCLSNGLPLKPKAMSAPGTDVAPTTTTKTRSGNGCVECTLPQLPTLQLRRACCVALRSSPFSLFTKGLPQEKRKPFMEVSRPARRSHTFVVRHGSGSAAVLSTRRSS